ncbi:putative P-loop containing nucleoside triphosphate hydrolase, leucine-rich repeat domain superfamily [Dioscorea sansibarensis]
MAMETAALKVACGCMRSLVVREDICYICLTEEKLVDLAREVKDVSALKEDVNMKLVDEEEKLGKIPTHQVRWWLEKSECTCKEAEDLEKEYRGKWFASGSCSINWCSRYDISRRADRLSMQLKELKREKEDSKFLAEIQVTDIAMKIPVRADLVEAIISPNLNRIISYLGNVAVNVVGICGMIGTGKTTLLKMIHNSVIDAGMMSFKRVIMIEDSHNSDLEKIQKKIAEELNLPNDSRRNILHYLQGKDFLFLLDCICQKVDFAEEIGIPLGGNKVIFTASNRDMCSKMRADPIVEMKCVEDEEVAWRIFNQNAKIENLEFDSMPNKSRVEVLAKEVVDKCGGLPLALTLFGQAMSNKKTVEEWQHVVNELNGPGGCVISEMSTFHNKLKVCYESLDTPTLKKCFLSFSLWHNHPKIYKTDVIQCWMGLGFIVFSKYDRAYDEGCYLLGRLESACLLKIVGVEVKLHHVVRHMVRSIASEDGTRRGKWIVRGKDLGESQVYLDEIEHWKDAERIAVTMDPVLKTVAKLSHNFPNLVSLMLQGNSALIRLPDEIFQQMKKLEYLDLSSTGIDQLPTGIKDAANLQYVNISRTKIVTLPHELAQLKELKFLICRKLKLFELAEGFISSLYKLGVLELQPFVVVPAKCLRSSAGNMKRIGMLVKSLVVFNLLSELPTCYIQIEQLHELESISFGSLSCKNHGCLENLRLTACNELKELVLDGSESHLKKLHLWGLNNLNKFKFNDVEPKNYFQKLRKLYIAKCKSLKNLPWVLHLPVLITLKIEQCDILEELVDGEGEEIQEVSKDHPTFPMLEILSVGSLPNLLSISNYSLIFPCLSNLIVEGCPKLSRLPFDQHIIRSRFRRLDCEKEWWNGLKWDDASDIKSYVATKINFKEASEVLSTIFFLPHTSCDFSKPLYSLHGWHTFPLRAKRQQTSTSSRRDNYDKSLTSTTTKVLDLVSSSSCVLEFMERRLQLYEFSTTLAETKAN